LIIEAACSCNRAHNEALICKTLINIELCKRSGMTLLC
jgi:hypothetical protein